MAFWSRLQDGQLLIVSSNSTPVYSRLRPRIDGRIDHSCYAITCYMLYTYITVSLTRRFSTSLDILFYASPFAELILQNKTKGAGRLFRPGNH